MTQFNDTLTSLTAGLTPARSKAQSVTYSGRIMTDQEIDNAVRFSSLARRVVEMPAQDMTRKWREWMGDPNQISKIEEQEQLLGLKQKYQQLIVRARKYGDSYGFIDNGEDPTKPLDPKTARPIRGFAALRPYVCIAGDIEDDPLSPFYDQPAYYEFAAGTESVKIHPTRIVHMIGSRRDDASVLYQNDSVLTAFMDDLKNHDGAMACLADMMYEAKIDVMSVKNLMERVSDPDTERAMTARYQLMAMMKSVNGMIVKDMDDEDYQQKVLSFAALPDVIDRFQIAASGAARIPRSKLFGVQTGGLGNAGESDDGDYGAMIRSKQENELQPSTHILDQLVVKTALGSIPDEVHYNWRALREMSDKEKAEIGVNITKKYVDAVNAGIFSAEFATLPLVNELTEAGISAGLEGHYNEWVGDVTGDDINTPPDDSDDGELVV